MSGIIAIGILTWISCICYLNHEVDR